MNKIVKAVANGQKVELKDLFNSVKMKCSEIIIDDIEWNRNIFLNIDGHEYDIRTWSFIPSEEDEKGHTCAESVSYTLFKTVKDATGSHGEKISDGILNITWKNE